MSYTEKEVRKALQEADNKDHLAKHMDDAGMKDKADKLRQEADNQRANFDKRGR